MSARFPVLGSLLVALVLAAAWGGAPSTASAQETGEHVFPVFDPAGYDAVLRHDELRWNPTGEWIFPTVIRAADHVAEPLGAYYLYTAPHGAPGGVSLFYSDALGGPWTEYEANPVLPNDLGVSHISSPHVMWNSREGLYFMYFHGENTHTRYATSSDGLVWSPPRVAVTARPGMLSASYARVFEYGIPRLGNSYTMLYTEAHPDATVGMMRIRYATSDDGRVWTLQPEVVITPQGIEGRRVASPTLLELNGRVYVAYHAASGDMHVTEVGPDFDRENHIGVFYDSRTEPDRDRAASPTFVIEGDTIHMFYESGPRLDATIHHVEGSLTAMAPVVSRHSGRYLQGYFRDVRATTHTNDVYALDRSGLTTGCGSPTRFCPTDPVTRGEMAVFLVRALRLPVTSYRSSFDDVRPRTFYTGSVEALRDAGITNGCGRNRFCPDEPVTRQEMAAFVGRSIGLSPRDGSPFSDVAQGTSFTGWINALYEAGITTGAGGGDRFEPEGLVTRQQMASFLTRAWRRPAET